MRVYVNLIHTIAVEVDDYIRAVANQTAGTP